MWRLFSVILSFTFFISCSNEPEVKKDIPFVPVVGDYLFKLHKDVPGEIPQVNDVVYYHLRHRNGKRVTYSSRMGGGNYLKYQMKAEPAHKRPSSIIVALSMMSSGDSATIRTDISQNKYKPPGYESANFMDIDIYLHKVDRGKDPLAFYLRQRLIEPAENTQNIKFNPADNEIRPGGPTSQSDNINVWNVVMEDKLNEVMYEAGNKYRTGELKGKLNRLPSGLEFLPVYKGNGNTPGIGNKVSVRYFGSNFRGGMIENFYKRENSIDVELGNNNLIKGLDEAIRQLDVGGTGIFFMPPELAYGEKGTKAVKPNAPFVAYYVKLDRIN